MKVSQSSLALCEPMYCSKPGSSVNGILQARILEWVAIPSSRGIFPNQGLNPGLPHCRQILYQLNHKGSRSVSVSKLLLLRHCQKGVPEGGC